MMPRDGSRGGECGRGARKRASGTSSNVDVLVGCSRRSKHCIAAGYVLVSPSSSGQYFQCNSRPDEQRGTGEDDVGEWKGSTPLYILRTLSSAVHLYQHLHSCSTPLASERSLVPFCSLQPDSALHYHPHQPRHPSPLTYSTARCLVRIYPARHNYLIHTAHTTRRPPCPTSTIRFSNPHTHPFRSSYNIPGARSPKPRMHSTTAVELASTCTSVCDLLLV